MIELLKVYETSYINLESQYYLLSDGICFQPKSYYKEEP